VKGSGLLAAETMGCGLALRRFPGDAGANEFV